MGDVTPIRPQPPAITVVAGLTIAEVDGEWYAFRPGSKAWRRRTGTYWRPIGDACETREEAERRARLLAIRPVRGSEEHHG